MGEGPSVLWTLSFGGNDVRLVDALASGLKAAVLVVLLALAWAMPAAAHSGHSQTSKAIAVTSPLNPQRASVDVPMVEPAEMCGFKQAHAWTAPDDRQRDGSTGRACCGTMCTVALVERGLAPLPLRTPHGIRLAPPPEALSLARSPGLHDKPPRTLDIA